MTRSIIEQAQDVAAAAGSQTSDELARQAAMRDELVTSATVLAHDLAGETMAAPAGYVATVEKLTPNQKRSLPWARIGTAFTGPMSAVQAVQAAGAADIKITTRSMGWYDEEAMAFTPTEGVKALLRRPYAGNEQELMLGTCGSNYTLLQNSDIAEALDRSGLTTQFPVSHVFTTDNGGGLGIALNLGKDELLGEAYQRFALWRDRRDGGSALTCETFYFRLICTNGMSSLDNKLTRISIRHTDQIATDFALAEDIVEQTLVIAQGQKQWLEELAEVPITTDDLHGLFEATWPMPIKSAMVRQLEYINPQQMDPTKRARALSLAQQYEYAVAQRTALIHTANDSYQRLIVEAPVHNGTALGGLQAVAEVADHSRMARAGSMAGLDGYRAEEKRRAAAFLASLR